MNKNTICTTFKIDTINFIQNLFQNEQFMSKQRVFQVFFHKNAEKPTNKHQDHKAQQNENKKSYVQEKHISPQFLLYSSPINYPHRKDEQEDYQYADQQHHEKQIPHQYTQLKYDHTHEQEQK